MLIAGLALASRAAVAVLLGVVGDPERWEYDVIAGNLASGLGHVYEREGFAYKAYAPPLWSFLLAALQFAPGAGRGAIQLLQALLCAGAAVAFARMALDVFKRQDVALWAGVATALQPSLLYYSVVKSDPLPLNVLLTGAIALAGKALIDTPSPASAVRFGVLTGLGGLSRGTPLVAIPLLGGLLLARRMRDRWPAFGVACFLCVLTLIPWLTRTALAIGEPMITSTATENFWRGNHRGASGGIRNAEGALITRLAPDNQALPRSVRSTLVDGTEAERSTAFSKEARDFIMRRPHEAIALYLKKLRMFWLWSPSDPRDYDMRLVVAYNLIYLVELCLALAGVAWILRSQPAKDETPGDRTGALWCLGLALSLGAVQAAFYVQGRHRFLVEPILLLFAAIPLARAAGVLQARVDAFIASRSPRRIQITIGSPPPRHRNPNSKKHRPGRPAEPRGPGGSRARPSPGESRGRTRNR